MDFTSGICQSANEFCTSGFCVSNPPLMNGRKRSHSDLPEVSEKRIRCHDSSPGQQEFSTFENNANPNETSFPIASYSQQFFGQDITMDTTNTTPASRCSLGTPQDQIPQWCNSSALEHHHSMLLESRYHNIMDELLTYHGS